MTNISYQSVVSLSKIKLFLAFFFIIGWLFPKISVGGFNLGIQDVTAIFLICFGYKINSRIYRFFIADLFFAIVLFIVGFFYLFNNDFEGFLIGSRTLLFVIAVVGFTGFEYNKLQYLMKVVTFVYFVFIFFAVLRIIINMIIKPFDIINFFYGSDSYRVRSPFEPEGAASSQVPIGYMLALLLCVPTIVHSKFKKIIFLIGAIGTTSRASILSVVLVYVKKVNFRKLSALFAILILVLLGYIAFLKSFTLNEGELDGSAGKRLELYANSIKIMVDNPSSFLFGFGLSTKSLAAATGEGFYESFIVNSFMQGGLLLLLLSIWILLKSIYFDYKYKIHSISIVILLGNAIGGSNYFSMFAYPLMGLIVCLAFKNQNILLNEKNTPLNNIE